MDILKVVRRECVAAGRAPAGKAAALSEVAKLAALSAAIPNTTVEEVEKGLRDREDIGSTGFGKGIAIPHCRLDSADEFVVGAMSVPGGVDFDSLDNEKVRLIIFIVGPSKESSEHIRILSMISRALSRPDAVNEMVAASTDEMLFESLARHLADEPISDKDEGRSLFHVFVQDEELFRDILQVFGGTEPRFTAVIEAENARAYLSKVPLFAGLWADSPRSFSRVIVSLVRKKMTNELVRRIEAVAGPLSKTNSVLVTVQDVFFSGGSLAT